MDQDLSQLGALNCRLCPCFLDHWPLLDVRPHTAIHPALACPQKKLMRKIVCCVGCGGGEPVASPGAARRCSSTCRPAPAEHATHGHHAHITKHALRTNLTHALVSPRGP